MNKDTLASEETAKKILSYFASNRQEREASKNRFKIKIGDAGNLREAVNAIKAFLKKEGFKNTTVLAIVELPNGQTLFSENEDIEKKLLEIGFRHAKDLTILKLPCDSETLFMNNPPEELEINELFYYLQEFTRYNDQWYDGFSHSYFIDSITHYCDDTARDTQNAKG